MLKNKNGSNPFGIIEMLPDDMRPCDSVLEHAKSFYPKISPEPDVVRAWDKNVIFDFYNMRNGVVCLDQMVFSDGKIISWECE